MKRNQAIAAHRFRPNLGGEGGEFPAAIFLFDRRARLDGRLSDFVDDLVGQLSVAEKKPATKADRTNVTRPSLEIVRCPMTNLPRPSSWSRRSMISSSIDRKVNIGLCDQLVPIGIICASLNTAST